MQESITLRTEALSGLSLKIWKYAEAGFSEEKSAAAQITSCPASSFAQKAMLRADKVMGLTGVELLSSAKLRERAWQAFHEEGITYVTLLPEGVRPKLDIVKQ